jgi:putative colanic acid biosynthesis acetyltransferase WcaF
MSNASPTRGAGSSGAGWRPLYWRLIGRVLFRCSPHVAHGLRRRLLRLAGAHLTGNVKIRRSVRIDRPWNLKAGHLTIFGDHAALRLLCPVSIGERCVVSQHAILTTEMLDPLEPSRAIHQSITIEDDCWIAAETLVLPGAVVRAGTVVGARGMVEGELEGWSVAVGQPARTIKPRAFTNAASRAGIAAGGAA